MIIVSFSIRVSREKHSEEVIDEIYRQVESFAGYAFCKAHSASFALESFWEHELIKPLPSRFMAAVLSGGGGYWFPRIIWRQTDALAVVLHPPCNQRKPVSAFTRSWWASSSRFDAGCVTSWWNRLIALLRREQIEDPIVIWSLFWIWFRPNIEEASNPGSMWSHEIAGRTIPELLWELSSF